MLFPDQRCDHATGRNTGELGLGSMHGAEIYVLYRVNNKLGFC